MARITSACSRKAASLQCLAPQSLKGNTLHISRLTCFYNITVTPYTHRLATTPGSHTINPKWCINEHCVIFWPRKEATFSVDTFLSSDRYWQYAKTLIIPPGFCAYFTVASGVNRIELISLESCTGHNNVLPWELSRPRKQPN